MKHGLVTLALAAVALACPAAMAEQSAQPIIEATISFDHGRVRILQAFRVEGFPTVSLSADDQSEFWYRLSSRGEDGSMLGELRFAFPLRVMYAPPLEGQADVSPKEEFLKQAEVVISLVYDERIRWLHVIDQNGAVADEYDLKDTISDCGDGECRAGENHLNCLRDCPRSEQKIICNTDQRCTPPETAQNCPQDCAPKPVPVPKTGTPMAKGVLGLIVLMAAVSAALFFVGYRFIKRKKNSPLPPPG